MSALLLSVLADFWPIVAGISAALGWGAYQRGAGAKAEKAKQAEERLKARTLADEIDDAVAGRDPATNREKLKRWSPWGDM